MITSHAHPEVNTMATTEAGQPPYETGQQATENSPAAFEDDFDIPPINLPPAALEDQPDYNGASFGNPHQGYPQMYPQQGYPQHQQQQNWGYGNGYPGYEYNNGSNYGYVQHYHHPQQQPMGVAMGGPSPGSGSHNTPSPTGHSEDGDHEVRNNNVLKSQYPVNPVQQAQQPPTGHFGSNHPYAGHAQAHPHPGHPHAHAHHHMHQIMPKPKPKVSKRKKKRDPNEPQKPVSAYALFFRDSQASIKAANPNAAFGDVSKIVASMWDNLDPDAKANYKKRTENAKKEYLKKLAAYRASLVSKGGGDIGYGFSPYQYPNPHELNKGHFLGGSSPANPSNYMGQPIPPRPPMQQVQPPPAPTAAGGQPLGQTQHHMHHQHNYMMHQQASHMQQNGMMSGGPPMHGHGQPQPQASPLDSQGGHSPTSSNTSQTPQTTPTGAQPNREVPKLCGRPGCQNQVQRAPDGWQSDFCSNECVVGQCREVYTTWSSTSGGPPPNGPPVGPPHQAGPPTGPPQNYPQQQQPPTAVVK